MKKLFALMTAALLGFGTLSAQTTQQTSTTQKKATHMTRSGKPDMRYKENKTTTTSSTPAGPTKKDGSLDMRYKANKATKTTATKKS